MNRLAVIVVNYRTPKLAIACIRSIAAARAQFAALDVVVVDGHSDDGSAEAIAAATCDLDWVRLLALDVNGGFAFANNQAFAAVAAAAGEGAGGADAPPDAIALVNPDARVTPGALEAMMRLLEREPGCGAVGAQLVHEDGRPQASAFTFPTLRGEFARGARTGALERLLRVPPPTIETAQATEVPWVTGAAVMFRTRALERVGLFDEGFFLYFEETDLMRRLRRGGWSIWHEPAARVVHEGGVATNIRDPSSGTPRRRRMPAYWYAARRRYFALARGRGFALLAGVAWLLGVAWWKARLIVAPQPDEGPLRSVDDLLRHGFWPARGDAAPAVPSFGEPASAAPAWMRRR